MKLKILLFIDQYLMSLGFALMCIGLQFNPELVRFDINGYEYYGCWIGILVTYIVLSSAYSIMYENYFLKTSRFRRRYVSLILVGLRKKHIVSFLSRYKHIFVHGFEDMIYMYPVLLLPENLRLYGLGISAVIFYLHHGYQGKKTALLPVLILLFLIYPTCRDYGMITGIFFHGFYDLLMTLINRFSLSLSKTRYKRYQKWLNAYDTMLYNPIDQMDVSEEA